MNHKPTRRTTLSTLAAALFLGAVISTPAQTPTKVLLWGGPATTSHNVPAFRDTIVPYLTSQNMTVTYRQSTPYSFLHADSLSQYDVMLMYTTNQDASQLTQGQLSALTAWVASGRVIVALHGSTNTFINNNATITAAWRALLGAQYVGHGPLNTSGTVARTAAGDVHSCLQGTLMLPTSGANTGDSPYWDEGREHTNYVSDTTVLARSTTASSNFPWIWVRPQGNGWIYYNASGHDNQVWRRIEFKNQILRALTWGHTIKTTGIHGRAAVNALVRTQGHEIIVPLRAGYSLEVTDMQGRRVHRIDRSNAARQNLGFLANGTYGVRVLSAEREAIQTLFIKRP